MSIELRHDLSSLVDLPLWSMGPDETTQTVKSLDQLAAQVAELQARVLVHATALDLPGDLGANSPGAWLATVTRATRADAHAAARLAAGLEIYPVLRSALAVGEVNTEQARVINRTLTDLADEVDAKVLARAETELVRLAADHDAKALNILGRRILEVAAPDLADEHERKLLERQERCRGRGTAVHLVHRGRWGHPGQVR